MATTSKLRKPYFHPLQGFALADESAVRPRIDLAAMPVERAHRRDVRASYDAARDSEEFSNHWANADALDADSANSREVRQKLVQRSRYEICNNGYLDGMVQTYATDLVGKGPKLRMQTSSQPFNAMVENEWYRWCKATKFRRKLWCMAHAKASDGEGLGVIRRNPKVKHRIKLDIQLYETEQCQTPFLLGEEGRIDGISFDKFGNPEFYDILQQHPGSNRYWTMQREPERVPAEFVLHWFAMRRPGQHRGIPEFASTLNVGASSRRYREAVVGAAESVAALGAVLLKTTLTPDDASELANPMDTMAYQKRMMTVLPDGYDCTQLKPEQPAASYDTFVEAQISETARPKNMPKNKAMCDSSSYNYASGRLDHQTYYASLDVEREDGNDLVLEPVFEVWFRSAVNVFGWLGGNPDAITVPPHAWDWPMHPVTDQATEAEYIDKRLRNGTTSLSRVYAEAGEDFEDDVSTLAQDYYGDTSEESVAKVRETIRAALFNSQNQQASMEQSAALTKQADTAAKVADKPAPKGAVNGK